MTTQNKRSGPEVAQYQNQAIRRVGKSHADYWHSRLQKRTYPSNGKLIEIPEWQIRIKHLGRRQWFNLGTANRAAASAKARDVYLSLISKGWGTTLDAYKPDMQVSANGSTIGSYLSAVRDSGYLRLRTFLNYQNCLRTIVSESFGVKAGATKYDYKHGGNQKWVERIEGIRLERFTPERVEKWKSKRLKLAGNSPIAEASAKRTCNSYIRCARSLFAPAVRQKVKGIQLPARLPFEGVELFESGDMRYISKINVQTLVAAAKNELKANEPESYKVFLLGLFGGMRKGEIDLAEWGMVNWDTNLIALEETEFLHLKTQSSKGEISIDPEVIEEIREMMPASKSRFIITSDRPARNDVARPYYRCEVIFDRLTKWLRSKGVKSNKPLHELRKEIGALITTEHGIYAASRFLRHSDITTTARHYSEHKTRISVGLGKLLDTTIKPAAEAV